MTQEDKKLVEKKLIWWLDHIQDLAARMGIENICINISADSVDVRFYADDFEKRIGEMRKYNGEDEELKELYPNEWLTQWKEAKDDAGN